MFGCWELINEKLTLPLINEKSNSPQIPRSRSRKKATFNIGTGARALYQRRGFASCCSKRVDSASVGGLNPGKTPREFFPRGNPSRFGSFGKSEQLPGFAFLGVFRLFLGFVWEFGRGRMIPGEDRKLLEKFWENVLGWEGIAWEGLDRDNSAFLFLYRQRNRTKSVLRDCCECSNPNPSPCSAGTFEIL